MNKNNKEIFKYWIYFEKIVGKVYSNNKLNEKMETNYKLKLLRIKLLFSFNILAQLSFIFNWSFKLLIVPFCCSIIFR